VPEALWVVLGRDKLLWEVADPEWASYLEQIRVGELAPSDARKFLSSCGIQEQDILNALIAGSTGVPFYLDIAVTTYYNIPKTKRRPPEPSDFASAPRELVDSFLHYLDAAELRTLSILSLTRFWDEELFTNAVKHFETGYSPIDWPILRRHSFIEATGIPDNWTMHSLMRAGLQSYMMEGSLRSDVNQFLLDYYSQKIEALEPKEVRPIHARFLEEAFYHGQQCLELSSLLNWFSRTEIVFRRAAQWRVLVPLQEKLVELSIKSYGLESDETAHNMRVLADLYEEQAQYKEAETLYEKALQMEESILGTDHPRVAATLNNLAGLYQATRRYKEAEPLYLRALEIKEMKLGKTHSDTGTTLNNMAELYLRLSQPQTAEPLFKRALAIKKKRLGREHPQVGIIMNNLGELTAGQGKYREAKKWYEGALTIKEKALGSTHPSVGITFRNIADLFLMQGKYSQATLLYLKSLEILEEQLPWNHPTIIKIKHSLEEAYQQAD
jgi:tetratricopeptide (TPR) repeat protein